MIVLFSTSKTCQKKRKSDLSQISRKAKIARSQRDAENPEQSQARRKEQVQRQARLRAVETPEQTEYRRRQQARYMAYRYRQAVGTLEQSQAQLQKQVQRQARLRAAKTQERALLPLCTYLSMMAINNLDRTETYRKFCSVIGCNSKPCKSLQLSFHRFPCPDRNSVFIENRKGEKIKMDALTAWKKVLKMESKPVTKNMFVCSLHFKKTDYFFGVDKAVKRRLKKTAIPSINLPKAKRPLLKKEPKILTQSCTVSAPTEIDINDGAIVKSEDASLLKMTATTSKCFVPGCPSTYKTIPIKIFFPVPSHKSAELRKQWFDAIGQPPSTSKNTLYCCQDHFDLEKDTENYLQFTAMQNTALKLKREALPHIFSRQDNVRKRKIPITAPVDNDQEIVIKEEDIDSDFEDDVAMKKERLDLDEQEATPSNSIPTVKPQIVEVYVTAPNIIVSSKPLAKPPNDKKYKKVRNVGIQVRLRPPHRSIGIMAKLEQEESYDETMPYHYETVPENIKKELFYDESCEEINEFQFETETTEAEEPYVLSEIKAEPEDAPDVLCEIKTEKLEPEENSIEVSEIKIEKTEIEYDGEFS